jgi:hypothetical protein
MEQERRSRRPTSNRAILRAHPLPLGAPSSLMASTSPLPVAAVLADQRCYVVGPRSVVVLMGKMHEQRYSNLGERLSQCRTPNIS